MYKKLYHGRRVESSKIQSEDPPDEVLILLLFSLSRVHEPGQKIDLCAMMHMYIIADQNT